jgi:2-keto-myo-inositol isomerase
VPVRRQQISFAVNHMSAPGLGPGDLLRLAADTGCVGVEFRNDLANRQLFDGITAAAIGSMARDAGVRILALAEVKRFNAWSGEVRARAAALIETAAECGAEAVSLIPTNDGTGLGNGERQAMLRVALRELAPMLEEHDLTGLIEPLGFETSALRHKEEVVNAITALGAGDRFRLIHDTFHHFVAGEEALFPGHTGMVHVSGVVDASLGVRDMRDRHRVLVGPGDRIGNVEQVARLLAGGYAGPISSEPFAAEVHGLARPGEALVKSFDYLRLGVARRAA